MLKKTTTKILEKFKRWLKNSRHFVFSRYAKDAQEIQPPERSLVELPKEVREKLVNAVDNLPINPGDNQAIAS